MGEVSGNNLSSLEVHKIINIKTKDPAVLQLYNISERNKTIATLYRNKKRGLFFKIKDEYKSVYTEDDLEEVILKYLNNKQ